MRKFLQDGKSRFVERQIERRKEQFIAMSLEENEDFFIIDIEVVIKGTRIEGDLLALVKQPDGSYRFLPIELKLASKNCHTAAQQGCEFAKIVKENYGDFHKNYQMIYDQKWRKIMNKKPIRITTDEEVNEALVLIITAESTVMSNKEKHNIAMVREHANQIVECSVKVLAMTEQEFVDFGWRQLMGS